MTPSILNFVLAIPFCLLVGLCRAGRVNTYASAFQLPSVVGNSFGVPGVNATYDYIVVGGGTAGLAIAARLAQQYSVAVVEAGGFYEIENGNGSMIPGLCFYQGTAPTGPSLPLIDWNFKSVPQTGCLNRTINYQRGKTLGGSSARNFLAFHRPTVGSMQQWADDVGDTSYTWDNVLPYFDRTNKITLPNTALRYPNSSIDFNDTAILQGAQNGTVPVTWPNYAPALYSWFYQAFQKIGLVANHQAFLGGVLDGIAYTASSMDPAQQQRASSQTTYLYQATLETDIKVYTQTLFKQVLFNDNSTATGVLVTAGGQKFHLNATREVILSGGALQSPQMLMVSGIGPRTTLEKYNITVRKDLPGVGQNMWDHILSPTLYQVNMDTADQLLTNPQYAAQAAQQYLANQTGILTVPPGMLAWERLTGRSIPGISISNATTAAMSSFPQDWPEVEYLPNSGGTPPPLDGKNYGTIFVALITPLSRGNVTIQSADTSDPPLINLNYLTHPADIELMVNGFKRVRSVWSQLTNVTIGPEFLPGQKVSSDAQIEEYIRASVGPVWHVAATCKMGRTNDTMAVVDSRARVYGVQSLRVVDASAFPFLTPGHPQPVVYMLAEKIADDILQRR